MSRIFSPTKPSPDEYLSHHGIKGMKWGVRRSRNFGDKQRLLSTESRSDRKQSSKNARRFLWDSIKDEPMFERMTEDDYNKLSTRGKTFAEGITLKRVALDSATTEKGRLYVSKYNADSEFYRAIIPTVGPTASTKLGAKRMKEKYSEVSYKTLTKLTVPSDKERVDAFMEIFSNPSIKLEGRNAPITGRKFLEDNGYKFLFRKKSDQEAAFMAYGDFKTNQGDRKLSINDAYFKNLQKKGYNAVIDENDQGRYTKTPLIILNANKTIKKTSIKQLSVDDINRAQRSLAIRR